MKNNEEDDLKEFANALRELAKTHPVIMPMQHEELSEKEIEEYWKSIIDKSKKRYSDMLSLSPETINEILQNYRDEERRKKYFKIKVLKRRDK